jgi:hypothetical protein
MTYVFVLGRRAFHAGHTGDVDPSAREDQVAVAD